MKLGEQINGAINQFREVLPSELNSLIEQGAGEISAMQLVENSLKVGDKAPDFSLLDKDGEKKSLSTYLGNGPVIVTFYRGLWCPYCNLQLAAYSQVLDEIRNLGADLVALTPEGPNGKEILDASAAPQEAKDTAVVNPGFDVLHDEGSTIAEKFGIVFTLPDSHKQVMNMLQVDIEKSHGNNKWTFADPATYIVGTDGLIKWAFVPNNYRKRAEPSEILEQLKKL